jgi:hypothetical protein
MTLAKRLHTLEGKRGKSGNWPSVVLLCDAVTGEAHGAIVTGGGALVRVAGESADAFTARATAGAAMVLRLPDNGRGAGLAVSQ